MSFQPYSEMMNLSKPIHVLSPAIAIAAMLKTMITAA